MTAYFDTGIILKLYTEEPESEAVRAFVIKRGQAIGVRTLYLAECVSTPKWHEVKRCFGRKSPLATSSLHLPSGRVASRGRFRSKRRFSKTYLNFAPFMPAPHSLPPLFSCLV